MRSSILLFGLLASTAGCGNSSGESDEQASLTGVPSTPTGPASSAVGPDTPQSSAEPSTVPAATSPGGQLSSTPPAATAPDGTDVGGPDPSDSAKPTGSVSAGGAPGSAGASAGGSATGGTVGVGAGSGGDATGAGGAASGGEGGSSNVAGAAGSASGGENSGSPSSCVGDRIPSANPANAGPFQVTADKNVGPLAGVVPDPIYEDEQQRYNVYRPSNLADGGYCHPVLIWANGYGDNPEQNPPDCIVDSGANRWCGQYSPMVNHLASHGFVVVASLSTATAEGDPLPTIAGLDWILEQSEDPSSPYYHRLDTNNIGQLGHSYGGMSTCMSASEPRYKALATICGTRELSGVHTPMLFFCGGRDTTVPCSGVRDTFLSVTDQPAFFINELDADHGSWVYEGASGVSLSMAAAWFRTHLMDDAESRKFFYGPNCTFCGDNRVEVEQNSLMAQ